jgi:transketolase
MPSRIEEESLTLEAKRLALRIRENALGVTIAVNGSYLGQVCSAAEILAVLFGEVIDEEQDDMFVLSPAHYSLALYSTLVETGDLSHEELMTFGADGSRVEMIGGHGAPGMEFTTGSLAQGLSQAIGVALGRRIQGNPGRIFVYISDGELQEGQTWEALMSLAHFKLTNITVILDMNDSQVDGSPRDIMNVEPAAPRIEAFGLEAVLVDGHDVAQLREALTSPRGTAPRVVVATTNISEGLPSIAHRHNLHFVRFRQGESAKAIADLKAQKEVLV